MKKPLCFIWKIVKQSNFALNTNDFLIKKAGKLGNLRFSGIFDFAVCVLVLLYILLYVCRFCYIFLQKYRCVPKIGFSADIFQSCSVIFFRSIVVYLKLGSRLTFLSTFFIDIFIDIFIYILIDILIDILTWHFYWHLNWHFDLSFWL